MVMVVPMAACGKKENTDVLSKGEDPQELKNYVYREEELKLIPEEGYSEFIFSGDKVFGAKSDFHYDEAALYAEPEVINEANIPVDTVAENADADAVEADAAEGEIIDEAFEVPAEDQTYTFSVVCYDTTGKKLYGYEEECVSNSSSWYYKADESGRFYYVYEEYNFDDAAGTYSDEFYLSCIGADGKLAYRTPLGKSTDTENFYVNTLMTDGDKVVALCNNGIYSLDSKGEIVNTVSASEESMNNLGPVTILNNGEAIVTVYGEIDIEYHKFDLKTATVGEKLELPSIFNMANLFPSKYHDLMLATQGGLYYYDLGDEDAVKFLDFVASDMGASGLATVYETDEKTLIASYYDDMDGNQVSVKLTKVDPGEVKDKSVIVLGGMWIDTYVRRAVINFNKSSDSVRIVLKDYCSDNPDIEYNDILKNLNNELVSGNGPDIMLISQGMNLANFASKGILCDLNPLLEADTQIKREDYFTNIFDATTFDGKLCAIAPRFYLQTLFIKKSDANGKTSWNSKEFMDYIKAHPDVEYPIGLMSKEDFIYTILWANQSEFVDWNSGEVKFDNDEFVEMLEYTKNLPETIDYESEEVQDYWNRYDSMYREGRALIYSMSLSSLRDYNYAKQGMFGEDIVAIGYPTTTGCGTTLGVDTSLAINAKSNNKDAAWEFVRSFLLDEFQESGQYGIPVKKSAFDKMAKEAMERPYYMDAGKNVYYDDVYYINGQEIVINPATETEISEFTSYVNSTDRISGSLEDINNIVLEEARGFFAGQKSAQDVAKVIQSRVQIYVHENK